MTAVDIQTLQERVGNGMQWLSDHDPLGRYYAWWQAGLTPRSPLPAHEATPEVREQWQAWYNAKLTYDVLEKRLAREEERDPNMLLPWAVGWTGETKGSVRP